MPSRPDSGKSPAAATPAPLEDAGGTGPASAESHAADPPDDDDAGSFGSAAAFAASAAGCRSRAFCCCSFGGGGGAAWEGGAAGGACGVDGGGDSDCTAERRQGRKTARNQARVAKRGSATPAHHRLRAARRMHTTGSGRRDACTPQAQRGATSAHHRLRAARRLHTTGSGRREMPSGTEALLRGEEGMATEGNERPSGGGRRMRAG